MIKVSVMATKKNANKPETESMRNDEKMTRDADLNSDESTKGAQYLENGSESRCIFGVTRAPK